MLAYIFWTLLSAVLVLLVAYNKIKYKYWSSTGVDGPQPILFLGHIHKLYFDKRWEFIMEQYMKYKDNKLFGLYEANNPVLCVCNTDIIKQILVKDFNYFTNRRITKFTKNMEWFKETLLVRCGDSWKKLRATMSPAFSSGKIKSMFLIVNKKTQSFLQYCKDNCDKTNKLNIKDAFARFSLDVIAETAFGIKTDSFENESSEFVKTARSIFDTSKILSLFHALYNAMPNLAIILTHLMVTIFSNQPNPWVYMYQVSEAAIQSRRKENIKRADFIDLMLEQQSKQKEYFDDTKDYKITDASIIAQCTVFLSAGYDTTATALSVSSYYLAKHQHVQNKLRIELKEILEQHGDFDYHNIMEAKYLDACVSESLRLNPPIPWTERGCSADYTIEGSNLKLFKGQIVIIPVWAIHRDPEYWPDPDSYNPDRFLPENKANILPFTYMPFGAGPRNCIAMRFALMEAKCCLAQLIINYNIMLAPGHEQLILANGGGIIKPADTSVVLVMLPLK